MLSMRLSDEFKMPLSDFKENERFRFTDTGDLKPVGADMRCRKRGFRMEHSPVW